MVKMTVVTWVMKTIYYVEHHKGEFVCTTFHKNKQANKQKQNKTKTKQKLTIHG